MSACEQARVKFFQSIKVLDLVASSLHSPE